MNPSELVKILEVNISRIEVLSKLRSNKMLTVQTWYLKLIFLLFHIDYLTLPCFPRLLGSKAILLFPYMLAVLVGRTFN